MSRRFAIYFAPPEGSALEAFGRSWIGRDHVSGEVVPRPEIGDLDAVRVEEITAFPRTYGFHATLKAPFELRDGLVASDLHAAAAAFARKCSPFVCPNLQVSALSGFIALTLAGPSAAMDGLAADCVRAFEPLRAPLSEADLARRRQSPLTSRQSAQLEAWGYPYVFADFHFHMTLTGRLDDQERAHVLKVLIPRARPVTDAPFEVTEIAIYEQATRDCPFLLTGRFPFGGRHGNGA